MYVILCEMCISAGPDNDVKCEPVGIITRVPEFFSCHHFVIALTKKISVRFYFAQWLGGCQPVMSVNQTKKKTWTALGVGNQINSSHHSHHEVFKGKQQTLKGRD